MHDEQKERVSLEAFFALVESDPEHRYEYTRDDTIELRSLGVYFPVAEVYEKTTFDNTFTRDE